MEAAQGRRGADADCCASDGLLVCGLVAAVEVEPGRDDGFAAVGPPQFWRHPF